METVFKATMDILTVFRYEGKLTNLQLAQRGSMILNRPPQNSTVGSLRSTRDFSQKRRDPYSHQRIQGESLQIRDDLLKGDYPHTQERRSPYQDQVHNNTSCDTHLQSNSVTVCSIYLVVVFFNYLKTVFKFRKVFLCLLCENLKVKMK